MHEDPMAVLRRDGYVILRSVIPADLVGAVRRSVADTVRKHTSLPLPQGYVTGFLRLNQAIAPYLNHPRIMAIVGELFGHNARISMLTGTINGPGLQRGTVHADWPYNQDQLSCVRAPYPDVVLNLVTMWMLSRFTPANGGTMVIPGSHLRNRAPRKGTDLDPNSVFEGETQIEGDPGDVAVFDARTWHSIAPNVTDEERVGVLVRYAPWWVNLGPVASRQPRPQTDHRRSRGRRPYRSQSPTPAGIGLPAPSGGRAAAPLSHGGSGLAVPRLQAGGKTCRRHVPPELRQHSGATPPILPGLPRRATAGRTFRRRERQCAESPGGNRVVEEMTNEDGQRFEFENFYLEPRTCERAFRAAGFRDFPGVAFVPTRSMASPPITAFAQPESIPTRRASGPDVEGVDADACRLRSFEVHLDLERFLHSRDPVRSRPEDRNP